ncbi:DUF3592 domain-containing protein [Hymenobacter aerophilus]|uniref:DUF3592 domain-containing protein n=1 Tax=Hymenobacter aerophilus TaxID=119644 RepID=UPI0003645721|nr:DUF3592 domain-containing protein [Hymenobacter aerophilus]
MDFGLLSALVSVVFMILAGLWLFRDGMRQLELNRYLQTQGVLIPALITEAEIIREISYFKVTYQDEQERSYSAAFSVKGSNDECLYLAGAEIPVYYDPLHPERVVLATTVNSSWGNYENMLGGASSFVFGLYLLWKLWPQTT